MSMWKVQLDKMTKCSRNDTILFSAYPIHGSVIEENDEMSVIANTDMKLFTDPLAVRLRGATQLAADSQGTNTDLNRLSSLYLSNHVHTQLVHNSQGTNTVMELSVYPWVYSAGTQFTRYKHRHGTVCLPLGVLSWYRVPRCQSQLHTTPLTTSYIKDATEVPCLS